MSLLDAVEPCAESLLVLCVVAECVVVIGVSFHVTVGWTMIVGFDGCYCAEPESWSSFAFGCVGEPCRVLLTCMRNFYE